MEYTRYTNSVSMFYMDVDSEFVKAISAEISKRNLGLREAAQVIGTSHPTLGRVLAGDKVSFEFACQVAPFLRLPKEASVRLAGVEPAFQMTTNCNHLPAQHPQCHFVSQTLQFVVVRGH